MMLLCFSLTVLSFGLCSCDQVLVDYMASNLILRYELVDNWENVPDPWCLIHLSIANTGERNVEASDQEWEIYFNHMRLLRGTPNNPNGFPLGESGLRSYHINGDLHKITPDEDFPGWAAYENTTVEIFASSFEISKTDIFPNWYVTEDDTLPRTFQSTTDNNPSFIADFTHERQYLRSASELNKPLVPEARFEMNAGTEDMGSAGKRVIPTPVVESWDDEGPMIDITTGDWFIVLYDEELRTEAEFLSDKLNGAIIVDEAPASYFIGLQLGQVDDGGDEAYHLEVGASPDHVIITGNTGVGVFWAIQTLLTLSEDKGGIPVGFVTDYPRFPYRGVNLDVSRNFQVKQDILRLLEVMSMYKLNKFHFHLADDEGWRLEIPGLEELTEIGGRRCHDMNETVCIIPCRGSGPGVSTSGTGFYTVDDYKEILQYAQERHIQVIPELDMPGHAHAAIKAMEARYQKYIGEDPEKAEEFLLSDLEDESVYFSVQFFNDNAINPCIDSTYNFIQHVVQQVKALHDDIQPLTIYHFGGDEVSNGAWQDSPACEALIESDPELGSSADLMHYFVMHVADIVAEEGLNLAGWEDGLMHSSSEVYDRDEFNNEEVIANAWNNMWEWGSAEKAYLLANNSYRVVLSHATHLYFDFPYESDPEERGLYWGTRNITAKRTFAYMPDDVYANIDFSATGEDLDREETCAIYSCAPLDPDKTDYIIGMQAQLWSETVRTSAHMDNMFFPRVLAVAERSWHQADWEYIEDDDEREQAMNEDWQLFTNSLGHREMRRLDAIGVKYNVPPPGARLSPRSQDEVELEANVVYPGLPIRYSLDGGETWMDYSPGGVTVDTEADIRVVCTSADGSRFGRQVALP